MAKGSYRRAVAALVATVLSVGGCGRNTEFLTHVKKDVSLAHRYDHPLKEMQGNNKVDILFVVDNSGSMRESQAGLKKNAALFIDKFVVESRLDWRIGVLSAEPKDPPYVGMRANDILDKSLKDPISVFQNAIGKLGTSGVAEQPLDAVIKGLKENPAFRRPGAALAVIIVTDAKEQSSVDGAKFLEEVRALQPARSNLYVYGVIGNVEFGCPFSNEEPYDFATSPYNYVFTQTHGKYYKLCQDFGPSLADLSADLVTRIDRPYIQLKSRPYLKTVRVIYNGKELPGGPADMGGFWIYDFDLNRVLFHSLDFAPGENETVRIEYEGHVEQAKLPK